MIENKKNKRPNTAKTDKSARKGAEDAARKNINSKRSGTQVQEKSGDGNGKNERIRLSSPSPEKKRRTKTGTNAAPGTKPGTKKPGRTQNARTSKEEQERPISKNMELYLKKRAREEKAEAERAREWELKNPDRRSLYLEPMLFSRPYKRSFDAIEEAANTIISSVQRNETESGKRGRRQGGRERPTKKLRIIPLGGLGEIGKNITLFEYGDDIVIVDAGLAFPDEDMPGVDLVIPDFSYIINNAHKVRGVLITHGHEDHIGGIPYLLSSIDVPIYGTRLSLGIIEGKLDENKPPFDPRLYTVEAGDILNLGVFKAEFVHVNHSIADACAIYLKTPAGNVFHTGDFKLDVSPIDGKIMDLTRIGEIGKTGVDILLCESTNAERAGYTPSERTVGGSLDRIFMQNENNRLIIATFSSNVHRVQQIINASAKYGRRVAVLGRSMVNIIGAAAELGYMDIPDGTLIDISEIKRFRPEEITLITTGSQGEPMSALYRIAFSEHDRVKLSPNDTVVLSSSAIPGNEKLIGKIINALVKNGVKVVNDSAEGVHVSGHACSEEIKLLIALTRPKFFMPIHGEARHLYANRGIAEFMGIPSQNIFISEIGQVLELDKSSAAFAGSVPSGKVLVDGSGVGDIGSVVLRDRKHLSEDGLVVVVATIDMAGGLVISGPDIVSRGFVYVKESADFMTSVKAVAERALERVLDKRVRDFAEIKNNIRDDVAKFVYKETKRKPMIIPIIMDI